MQLALRNDGWELGLTPIHPKRRTSEPNPTHEKHAYLLRDRAVESPNEVWAADITYLPMRRGHVYLVAVMVWTSCRILSWRLSNMLDAGFWVEALNDALQRYGTPRIFNTDQGSQFTSSAFLNVLRRHGVAISKDGQGRWRDNVMVE